jgi:hypothetical protein
MPGQIGIGLRRTKRPQRGAMDHKRDRDIVGAADAIEMVLDVADHERDLVEVDQVIDDLLPAGGRALRGRVGTGSGERDTEGGDRGPEHVPSMHVIFPLIAASRRNPIIAAV